MTLTKKKTHQDETEMVELTSMPTLTIWHRCNKPSPMIFQYDWNENKTILIKIKVLYV